jgi:hypothetical protein
MGRRHGVRLLTGRRLTDADDQTTAMLSARAAEMIAPGRSPLGMVLRVALDRVLRARFAVFA